jgi:hypothetical protein
VDAANFRKQFTDVADPCALVRYGSDAILIGESSGEIVQVEYDVFY